jgi:ABC-type multidrug transport system fused ATPase/permease subunit
VMAFATVFAVLGRVLQGSTCNPTPHDESGGAAGMAGLALSYAIPIVGGLQGLINALAETEKEMVSVERIEHTIQDATRPGEELESPMVTSTKRHVSLIKSLNATVPTADVELEPAGEGDAIAEFSSATIQYKRNPSPTITRACLAVYPRDCVGVLGRTGSGKTTLLVALSRAAPLIGGSIHVMGRDIYTEWDERELRGAVCWIPQEPLLFHGSVLDNVDPWGARSPTSARRRVARGALVKCGFSVTDDDVEGTDDGGRFHVRAVSLDEQVGSSGAGWSVGERQLLALARAFVRKCSILCVDEATSSVDDHTSDVMMTALHSYLEEHGTTALMIAHRPASLRKCNRFVHVCDGRCEEIPEARALEVLAGRAELISIDT